MRKIIAIFVLIIFLLHKASKLYKSYKKERKQYKAKDKRYYDATAVYNQDKYPDKNPENVKVSFNGRINYQGEVEIDDKKGKSAKYLNGCPSHYEKTKKCSNIFKGSYDYTLIFLINSLVNILIIYFLTMIIIFG